MGGHASPTQPRWQWVASTPPGVLGGHWGGVAPVCGGCVDLRGEKTTSVGGSWAESVLLLCSGAGGCNAATCSFRGQGETPARGCRTAGALALPPTARRHSRAAPRLAPVFGGERPRLWPSRLPGTRAPCVTVLPRPHGRDSGPGSRTAVARCRRLRGQGSGSDSLPATGASCVHGHTDRAGSLTALARRAPTATRTGLWR